MCLEKFQLFEISDKKGYGEIGFTEHSGWAEIQNGCLTITFLLVTMIATTDQRAQQVQYNFNEKNTEQIISILSKNERDRFKERITELFVGFGMNPKRFHLGVTDKFDDFCKINNIEYTANSCN